jgi:DHA1 family bicyclomycin/chloramphenicol resistance-like MFS transporter
MIEETVDVLLPGSPLTTVSKDRLNPRPPTARNTFWLIILLGALSGLGPLAIDMYLPGFTAIAKEFSTSPAIIERTLAVYFAGLAFGQLFYGPATDRIGRKRPLYVGLIVFILASLGCAYTKSVHALILLRFLQAFGGCAEMVVARAVVRDYFEEREAARIFSFLMLVLGVAPIIAPLLGGWMLVHFGWRSIFWFLAAFACLCLLNVTFFLRESLPKERRRRTGFGATLGTYAELLSDPVFIAYTLSGGFVFAGMFAYISGSPFVFMELFHVSPERYGLFFGVNAIGIMLSAQVNGRLVRRIDPRGILRVALVVAAISGMVLLLAAKTHVGGFAGILIPLFVFMCSCGFSFPTATALAMAPHRKIAGSASALLGCLQFFVSGIAGLSVSALHNNTATPMALVIGCCGSLALVINVIFVRERETMSRVGVTALSEVTLDNNSISDLG